MVTSLLTIGLLTTAALNDFFGTFHDKLLWTTEFFEFSVIVSLGLVALFKWICLALLLFKYARFKPDWALLKQHLLLALPILLAIFVSGSSEYIDGLIVKNMHRKFGEVGFAVFRYGAKELPILLIVANTLSTAMICPCCHKCAKWHTGTKRPQQAPDAPVLSRNYCAAYNKPAPFPVCV